MQHPNLANWVDVVFTHDQAEVAIVMELATGGNARGALVAAGRLGEDRVRLAIDEIVI